MKVAPDDAAMPGALGTVAATDTPKAIAPANPITASLRPMVNVPSTRPANVTTNGRRV